MKEREFPNLLSGSQLLVPIARHRILGESSLPWIVIDGIRVSPSFQGLGRVRVTCCPAFLMVTIPKCSEFSGKLSVLSGGGVLVVTSDQLPLSAFSVLQGSDFWQHRICPSVLRLSSFYADPYQAGQRLGWSWNEDRRRSSRKMMTCLSFRMQCCFFQNSTRGSQFSQTFLG